MATTEKLLFDIELSKDKLLADLGQIRTRTAEIRTEQKALTGDLQKLADVGAQGTDAYKKMQAQLAANERELKGLARSAQEVNKSLDAAEASAGSYNRMAAEGAVLEKQLKQAAVGINITAEAYEQLRVKVEANKAAQRDFARSSGDMRALVGAYKEELGPAVGDVGAQVAALRAELAKLGAQRNTLDPATVEAQKLDTEITDLTAKLAAAEAEIGDVSKAGFSAALSLAQMRVRLTELKQAREGATAPEDFERFNAQILGLSTSIQQAEGRIDEFGDKTQKNLKRENLDTMSDAAQGLVGALSIATAVMGDNTNAAEVQARAIQAIAIAQNARAVAVGIANAREAASIVITSASTAAKKPVPAPGCVTTSAESP